MFFFIKQSKLEKVFSKFIERYKLHRINMGDHIFYESPYSKGGATVRYDKGDDVIIVYKEFYVQLKEFFSFDDDRTKELLIKWFRRQTGKKVKQVLVSEFPHIIKIYHGFPK